MADDVLRGTAANDPVVAGFVEHAKRRLPGEARVLLVGGTVRDWILGLVPQDYDFVVVGVSGIQLARAFGGDRNYFGGIALNVNGAHVDAWALEDTYHIRQFGMPATVDCLLDGAPLGLDKVALDTDGYHVLDGGCGSDIKSREISYAPAIPYMEHLQAARCLLLQERLNFALSDSAYALMHRAARNLMRHEEQIRTYLEMKGQSGALEGILRRIRSYGDGAQSVKDTELVCAK